MIKDHFPDYWLHPDIDSYDVQVSKVSSNTFTLAEPFPFFIEGGGQPDDKVTVLLPGFSDPIPVQKITSTYNFTLKLPKKFSSKPPFSVTLKLDLPFRKAVMRAHTCQHLLSALLLKHFSLKTLKAVMSDDQGQLVLDQPVPLDVLADIALRMNQFISSSPVPVTSHVLESASSVDQDGHKVDLSKIRGNIPAKASFVRVLSIGSDVDLNTCGGTHISSTDQMLSFFITSTKKNEIHFICGLKALSFLSQYNQNIIQVSQSANQPFDKTLDFVFQQFTSLSKQQHDQTFFIINLLRTFFESLHQKIDAFTADQNSLVLSSGSFKDILTWKIWSESETIVLLMACPIDKKLGSEAVKILSEFEQSFMSFLLVANDTLLINVNHPDKAPFNARDITASFKKFFPTSKGGGNDFFSQLLLKELDNPFTLIEQNIKTLF